MRYLTLLFLIFFINNIYAQSFNGKQIKNISFYATGEVSYFGLYISKDSLISTCNNIKDGKSTSQSRFFKTPGESWKKLLSISDTLNWQHTKNLISEKEAHDLAVDGAIMTKIVFYDNKSVIHSISYVTPSGNIKLLCDELQNLLDMTKKKGKHIKGKKIIASNY
ncbi:MAG: hypothetical protein JWR50_2949 [Mucilaginibacter sp.]|nr:hypothetical protein [Mucilaginibacter sp.]